MKAITPNRPYLLRAYYEWLMDNHFTPHVVVDAFVPGTQVPQEFVKDGQIVLNIAGGAVGNLQMTNEFVEFNARFGGVPQQVVLPMASIVAIYARENGAGTVFDMEDAYMAEDESLDSTPPPRSFSAVETTEKTETTEEKPAVTAEKPKGRAHLTVVK
ncbi:MULTISPECIES: ClpXP protease specificity-enhancing factor [Shewanella]|uniref:Stringent starvation protein B n=1 Tax=Shewanella japonica TaxID=93973 RepID=A0ABN4YQ33_9GAMM|nr:MULTISPECIES: ClpXP protease specificity-enhancing factor [Shewanella]ARD23809.1 Stringent starvation protein B [Shewanella japonica]KPZ70148.1 Stringent starvation protein B [Shewanella sp. P1-14-1]MBQ4889498.1 ClpXP protease specificity-enhancing factor [Shewanella sp. MMG014]OBT08264.1 ClpXP protease specificity-enhancing factor [Shewanella sp. UCD-FRSSP16_17]